MISLFIIEAMRRDMVRQCLDMILFHHIFRLAKNTLESYGILKNEVIYGGLGSTLG